MTIKHLIRNIYEMTVSCGIVIAMGAIVWNADAISKFFH